MTQVDWRSRLAALVAEGRSELAPGELAAALSAAAEQVRADRPAAVEPLRPPAPVLGVDACPAGWVGVLLQPDGRTTVHGGATMPALVEQVRESTTVSVVAIDIPIGLPDAGSRAADALARRALPGKASSVFTTLTRSAYAAADYADARAANVLATGGASASAQAYALGGKILEVDAWLRSRPGLTVIEVHPELSFARMAGAPLLTRKKDPAGVAERRAALAAAGLVAPAWFRGSGFGEDDLLDACAAVWTAARHARGEAESLPTEPETFSDGLPAAIRV